MQIAALLLLTALSAGPNATAEDFLAVLTKAPWPLEMLAWCHREVAPEAALQVAGKQWQARNGALFANIEAMAEGRIPPDIRRAADQASLAAIADTVNRQADRPAYCLQIARVVDSGAYDIDQRADLRDALKRIFGKD
jgi:hypothetical protein